jgi:hypothetical protein
MPTADAIHCIRFALSPIVQELARFALWNVEMEPWRYDKAGNIFSQRGALNGGEHAG